MSESQKPLTYAQSGVDIDVGNRIVDRIRPFARAHAPIRGGRGAWRIRRTVRSPSGGVCRPDPGRRQRRRRHKVEDRHRERRVRHDRHRPGGHVRQRHCRSGRRATVFLGLFCVRQARRGHRVRGRAKHRRGVRAIRMRIDRRRDGGDAGPLRRRRFRHRWLRRGRRRAWDAAAPARTEAGRSCLRSAVVRRPFQWVFVGAAHRRAVRARMGRSRPVRSPTLARRRVADADPPLCAAAASGADANARHTRARPYHRRRLSGQSAARAR